MIKVNVGANVIVGDLKTVDLGGTDLVLHLRISENSINTIDVVLPSFPNELKEFIKKMGIASLKNCVIDLNTGKIRQNVD